MNKSRFDLVMDYIDENIKFDTETIKRGIMNLIGINSNTFGQYFTVLTSDTLGSYIRNRRLYYAANDLRTHYEKSIVDIALDYGYSEQSSFTRAFSSKYGFSPNELRTPNVFYVIHNDKYYYDDFNEHKPDSRSKSIWREFERTGFIGGSNLEFLESVEAAHKDFCFDVDTCYAIADLAERLDVPPYALISACFDLVVEIKSEPDHLPNRVTYALDLGLQSCEDLEKICEHYACKAYELNDAMVEAFYASLSQD